MKTTIGGFPARSIHEDEFPAFVEAAETAFGEPAHPDDIEHWGALTEFDRTLAVFDGDQIVGTSLVQRLELTVPGGVVPMAGVTGVGVLPTHRRRGLLRGMMAALLEQALARGEPVAGLWASEAAIYWRYGYGLAARRDDVELAVSAGAFRQPVHATGNVRLLGLEQARERLSAIYERARPTVPGMLERSTARWQERLRDPEHRRDGASPRFIAVHDDGYVLYRIRQVHDEAGPSNDLRVEELVATGTDAARSLWRYLLDIDLVGRVSAFNRPVDDPLECFLAAPDRLVTRRHHSLWLRLLDVPAALSARRYAADGRLVLAVTGDLRPPVAGVYRLDVTGGRATCTVTEETPDLELSAADLAAVYLGGTRLSRLAHAGLVTEHTDGARRRATAMFAADPAPWCPFIF